MSDPMKFAVTATVLASGIAAVAPATAECFLKVEGVQGESRDSKHGGEVDVVAWSWGVTQSGSTHAGAGTSGKSTLADLKISKRLDQATAPLAQASASGRVFKTAVLACRKPSKTMTEFLTVTLNSVVVSSVKLVGDRDVPSEEITLSFGRIKLEYRPQSPDGTLGPAAVFGWDLATNKPM